MRSQLGMRLDHTHDLAGETEKGIIRHDRPSLGRRR